MWNSKGRSGYGEQTILGNYDDWAGLSPNGRQVKNELTNETRNLSGADYWHARKSIKPDEITPEVWVNGRANVKAFADTDKPVTKKTKKPIPIGHKIIPQQRTLNRLDEQELELHKAYKKDEISIDEYEQLLYALDQKRERAFKALCKATGRGLEDDPVGQDGEDEKTSKRGLYGCNKLMFDSNSLSSVGDGIKNDWKSDVKLFLTGSVIGLIVLLTLINI